MSTSDPGPGVQWLAQRSGRRVEELLEDHVALVAALTASGRDAAELVARLVSEDPQVRAAAEVEARAVRAWFAAHDDPARGHLEEPGQKVGDCGLARSGLAYQGDTLAPPCRETHIG